jgi:hypothetical protein
VLEATGARAALSAHRRARAQREEVERLRAGLAGRVLAELPLVFTEALDATALAALSRELEGAL